MIVSKDFTAEDDGGLTASSSRSSLFLVEDPSADEVMLNGEKDEEPENVAEVPDKHQSIVDEKPLENSKEALATAEPEEVKEVKVRNLAKHSAEPKAKLPSSQDEEVWPRGSPDVDTLRLHLATIVCCNIACYSSLLILISRIQSLLWEFFLHGKALGAGMRQSEAVKKSSEIASFNISYGSILRRRCLRNSQNTSARRAGWSFSCMDAERLPFCDILAKRCLGAKQINIDNLRKAFPGLATFAPRRVVTSKQATLASGFSMHCTVFAIPIRKVKSSHKIALEMPPPP